MGADIAALISIDQLPRARERSIGNYTSRRIITSFPQDCQIYSPVSRFARSRMPVGILIIYFNCALCCDVCIKIASDNFVMIYSVGI